MPPPPPTFSTITCWPSCSPRLVAMMRPTTSIGPPAAKGTTMVTGRAGQVCVGDVCASAGSASIAAKAAAKMSRNISVPSLQSHPQDYTQRIIGKIRTGEALPAQKKRRPTGLPFHDSESDARELRHLFLQVREHGVERLLVHIRLELVTVLQRQRLLRRRPRADLVGQTLEVGEFRPRAFAEHVRHEARPAPDVLVDDGVGVAQHVLLLAKAR